MISLRLIQAKPTFLLLAVLPGSAVIAQTWKLSSAPTNSWFSVAESADGTKIVAVAASDSRFGPLNGLIYVSTNSGATWQAADAPQAGWTSAAASPDGVNWLAACQNTGPANGIYRSTNSGQSWVQVTSWLTNIWSAVAGSADGGTLVAADPGGGFIPARLFTSTNAGVNWTATMNSYDNWSSLAASKDGTKWMATSRYQVGGVYFSGDGAQTWTQTTAPGLAWSSVACSADGRQWLAAQQGVGVYLSTNSGATWTKTMAPTADWTGVASSADGTRLVAVADNGPIYSSTNSGLDWTDSGAPTNYWRSVSSSADGGKLVAIVGGFNSSAGENRIGPIYTFQAAPAPQLSVKSSGSNVSISWIIPSINFVLQQNASLKGSDWLGVEASRVLNPTNLHYEVNLLQSTGPMFFRLASQ